MLAGPPRVVSLITVLLMLGVGWWYLRLAQTPIAETVPGLNIDNSPQPKVTPTSSLQIDTSPSPNSFKPDALDFSWPLKFSEGVAKPPGSNYTHVMVVPKTEKEDLMWMRQDLPDFPLVIYEVDNPNAENKIPKNKGREAMVYLSYIIDHYDDLPDIVIFIHAHRHAWHNNMLMGLDAVQMMKRLNFDRVARHSYMNIRCHHEPGCPDWIRMDRPGGDFDFFKKPEEIHWRRHIWEELHPGAPIPSTLSGICCAQFAVTRERIREIPIERFHHYRNWLLQTTMDDAWSGRIFEYIWHYIFTGHEVLCPEMNTCYCDGYGFCFGGRAKFLEFFEKQDERNKKNEELRGYTDKEDKAKEKGKTIEWKEEERKRMLDLNKQIASADAEMEKLRNEAIERGNDPKMRAEETENYDSSHIWDYAPKNDG